MRPEMVTVSRRRFFSTSLALFLVLVFVAVISASIGSVFIHPLRTMSCLLALRCDEGVSLILNLRLARVAAATLVGSMLALAGVLAQGITRNPLADPYVIGVSSAALAAVSLALFVDPSVIAQRHLLMLVAFVGALAGYVLTTTLSLLSGGTGVSLVLSGIAVTAVFSGVSHILLYLAQDRLRHPYIFLLLGSTSGVLWRDILYLAVSAVVVVSLLLVAGVPKALNAYLFGDVYASQLGYRVKALLILTALTVSVLAGSAVAVIGVVGFIGLAGPHIARALAGTSDHRVTLVLSALTGSIFAVSADTLTRLISGLTARGELPLGVVTSAIGAPVLAYLVVRGGGRRE